MIVNDFIDMRDEKHRRGVERALHNAVRRDRARTKILHISLRTDRNDSAAIRPPRYAASVYEDCPCCSGTAQVKTAESMAIDVM